MGCGADLKKWREDKEKAGRGSGPCLEQHPGRPDGKMTPNRALSKGGSPAVSGGTFQAGRGRWDERLREEQAMLLGSEQGLKSGGGPCEVGAVWRMRRGDVSFSRPLWPLCWGSRAAPGGACIPEMMGQSPAWQPW